MHKFRLNSMNFCVLLLLLCLTSVVKGQNPQNAAKPLAKGQNQEENDVFEVNQNQNPSNGNDMEQCQAVCVDIFFLLPDDPMSMSACQRGCRMFNIIYLRDDRSLNYSKDECYSSCADAYSVQDLNSSCRKGCKNMQRKKQSELEAVIVYIEQDAPQPELDELEMNWFIENYAPRDLHYLDNSQAAQNYKIPESMYRTLPIETLIEELAKPAGNRRQSGDWLDCASRNSGIPKWMLVSAIIAAIMVALYLSISSEKKVIADDILLGDEENDDLEHQEGENVEKIEDAGPLPAKTPLKDDEVQLSVGELLIQNGRQQQPFGGDGHDVRFAHAHLDPPPKYTVESERV